MTKVSQTILLKRWTLYLREILDIDMVNELFSSGSYGNELEESCAKILNVVEVCTREEITLSPTMATGVLLAILSECDCVSEFPDEDDLMNWGYLLAKETGYSCSE